VIGDYDREFAQLTRNLGSHTLAQDAVQLPAPRSLPRHRARRTHWKPERSTELQTIQPQHAYDRDTLVG
jgi:hypothetical protein